MRRAGAGAGRRSCAGVRRIHFAASTFRVGRASRRRAIRHVRSSWRSGARRGRNDVRSPDYIRDPVEREKVSKYLRHRLKIADARLNRLRLTELQQHHLEGERHAAFVALMDLCDERYHAGDD